MWEIWILELTRFRPRLSYCTAGDFNGGKGVEKDTDKLEDSLVSATRRKLLLYKCNPRIPFRGLPSISMVK